MQFLPATTAVWLFFIISGFYMQMIASGKYGSSAFTFYTNRALRLYPTYFAAAAIALPFTNLAVLLTVPTTTLYFLTLGANTTLFGGTFCSTWGNIAAF
jgi:peptidoglycan/LPS O-acetylase OafA/YrhL